AEAGSPTSRDKNPAPVRDSLTFRETDLFHLVKQPIQSCEERVRCFVPPTQNTAAFNKPITEDYYSIGVTFSLSTRREVDDF
ncbi:hypothetical protein BaRGS_00014140, partial [Batillaria attramentaria]